jgi:hypothetical protein
MDSPIHDANKLFEVTVRKSAKPKLDNISLFTKIPLPDYSINSEEYGKFLADKFNELSWNWHSCNKFLKNLMHGKYPEYLTVSFLLNISCHDSFSISKLLFMCDYEQHDIMPILNWHIEHEIFSPDLVKFVDNNIYHINVDGVHIEDYESIILFMSRGFKITADHYDYYFLRYICSDDHHTQTIIFDYFEDNKIKLKKLSRAELFGLFFFSTDYCRDRLSVFYDFSEINNASTKNNTFLNTLQKYNIDIESIIDIILDGYETADENDNCR